MKGSAVADSRASEVDAPGHNLGEYLRHPAEWDLQSLKAGAEAQYLGGDVGRRADAGSAKCDRAGLGLGGSDELLQRLDALFGRHDGDVGRTAEGGNGRKILGSIVGRIGINRRRGHVRGGMGH